MEFINNNRSAVVTGLLISIILLLVYLLSRRNTCEQCVKYDTKVNPISTETITQDTSISNNKPTVICYYATWCGHSRMFLPEWDEFEKIAKRKLPNLIVKKIECQGDNEQICNNRGIGGFPTIIMYNGNKQIEYEDDRKTKNLIAFCKQHM